MDSPRRPSYNRRMKTTPASPRFVASLGVVLAFLAALSAIDCHYPQDFWLENVLVLTAVAYLALSYSRAPLSRLSYVLILIFLALHELGAHSTFAEVPYDTWSRAWLGFSLNDLLGWQRNHYDRLVHFSYGLLITPAWQETLTRHLALGTASRRFLAWIFVLATSTAYELLEWAAALVFGGDLGQAYLGTQGDVWDSHKDTALALAGATLAIGLQWIIHRKSHAPR